MLRRPFHSVGGQRRGGGEVGGGLNDLLAFNRDFTIRKLTGDNMGLGRWRNTLRRDHLPAFRDLI